MTKPTQRRTIERHGRRVTVETWSRPEAPAGPTLASRRGAFLSAAGSPGGASIDAAAQALDQVFGAIASRAEINPDIVASAGESVIEAVDGIGLAAWLDSVRAHHNGTFQHCLIVTGVATYFGQKTGMRRADIALLTMAGLVHDIGKAQIPLDILDKPGRLTKEEFAVIKAHPAIGHDYLAARPDMPRALLAAVRGHHEYLDGSGYPDGLAGAEIDDVTRILTVCDVYGALIEKRAYKPPKSPRQAGAVLLAMADEGKVERGLARALMAE